MGDYIARVPRPGGRRAKLPEHVMIDFIKAGGPFMVLLILTSLVGLAFIIERGLALRWGKVIPAQVEEAMDRCHNTADAGSVVAACNNHPSPLSRILLAIYDHGSWPRQENVETAQTKARHEVVGLERGLVVLEVVVGIAPLLGLVGTLHGLITLFAELGKSGLADNASLAKGISIALNTTLMGLMVAIPALVAWSYYVKKVETISVEMESFCDRFLRAVYHKEKSKGREK